MPFGEIPYQKKSFIGKWENLFGVIERERGNINVVDSKKNAANERDCKDQIFLARTDGITVGFKINHLDH